MTRTQRLKLRASELSAELGKLGDLDSPTPEQLTEMEKLGKEFDSVEIQYRAALRAEPETVVIQTGDVDPETRERLELRARASLTNYLKSAIGGKAPGGAEAELQQAAGVDGIPLELFEPQPDLQLRADAVTAAPGTVGVNLDPIRPAVFSASIAPRLGIEMPRVESGTYATATITTSLTAGTKGKGDEADSTAAAFTVSTAIAKRVSARMSIRLEDIASVGQANFESALRENLTMILSDALDNQAINGAGANDDLIGIFHRLTDPSDPTSVADFDAFAGAHAGGIEGLWSNTIKDISIVCGPVTYVLASKTFQSATNYKGEMSAASYAEVNTGGLWTNKRMPAPASNIQQAILHRMGRAGIRTALCPHWGEVGISDIYSGSAKAERYVTFHVLLGDVILVQPDAYKQIAFKTA